jgi:hypothetical protein
MGLPAVIGGNHFLPVQITGIGPHPPRPQQRLGIGLRHLARAVGSDVQQEHIAMTDTGALRGRVERDPAPAMIAQWQRLQISSAAPKFVSWWI